MLNKVMKKGFTLMEVVIAVFLITAGTLAAYALIQRTIAFTTTSTHRLIASYLSQEGIELVRNVRDTNWLEQRDNPSLSWDDGLTGCGTGCELDYNDSAPSLYADRFLKIDGSFYNYELGNNTIYKRKIKTLPGANLLEVTVEVSWQERGKSYKIAGQENLYNWR